jgi:hypothetical protein
VVSTIWGILIVIWKAMVPPMTAPDQEQYWYRIRLALVACGAFVGLICSQLVAYGVSPWFDGFAKASEVRYVRVHLLDEELLSLRIHQCTAATGAAKQEYLRRIQILEDEYLTVEHIQYQLPACSDL